jgi:hypothetical protein
MNAFEYLNDPGIVIRISATVTSQNAQVVSSLKFIDWMMSLGPVAQIYFL